jgi:hypothetical protein
MSTVHSNSTQFTRIATSLCLALLALSSTSRLLASELAEPSVTGTRRALIICGLTGDTPEHDIKFAATIHKLHLALTERFHISPENIQVLFGGKPPEGDSPDPLLQSALPSTRENIEQAASNLTEATNSADGLWVICLGHVHYDGKHAWFNIPGPDLHSAEFAKLFASNRASEQVFFVTMSCSGYYIKPLSAAGRVIISATEPDWETSETDFPHELAELLANPPAAAEMDIDQDSAVTLLDLFLLTAKRVTLSYLDQQYLVTEHALLDDDGNGQGTELQRDFLTIEQGGRVRPSRKPTKPAPPTKGDGQLARSISLTLPATPPSTPAAPADQPTP